MHLEASDLEVRFDESSSRVDSVRMQHGGRIEFMETADPKTRPSRQTQFTLVEWLRSSLQAKLDEQRQEAVLRNANVAMGEPTFNEEGIPIFRSRDAQRQAPKPPAYLSGRSIMELNDLSFFPEMNEFEKQLFLFLTFYTSNRDFSICELMVTI